jgi:Cu+-exporting ATPase
MTEHHQTHAPTGESVIDPVCGMTVDPAKSPHYAEHGGAAFHFCSAGCLGKFKADPDRYLKPKPAAPASAGTIYTCPMHPQIRQTGPGACPICGMALEPETITADSGPNPELADMKRRFWIGLALAAPVFILEMGGHLLGHAFMVPRLTSDWLQFALSTPVVLWAGWPFFQRGWASLVSRNLNMFTLIAMGVGVSYSYSVVGMLAPGVFPPALRGEGGAVPVYFEAAAVITVLGPVDEVDSQIS